MNCPDELCKSLTQVVQQAGACNAPTQRPINYKMDGIDVRKLDSLKEVPILPILPHQGTKPAFGHERAEPFPLLWGFHE